MAKKLTGGQIAAIVISSLFIITSFGLIAYGVFGIAWSLILSAGISRTGDVNNACSDPWNRSGLTTDEEIVCTTSDVFLGTGIAALLVAIILLIAGSVWLAKKVKKKGGKKK